MVPSHTMEGELRPSKCLPSLLLAEQTMQHLLADGDVFSTPTSRRSANYQPSIWDDSYIQSLPDGFLGATHVDLWENLKEEVRNLIDYDHKQNNIVELLEIVDALCQLGISYHFESEIKNVEDFLVRSFRNESGGFNINIINDVRGLLSLYEASFLTIEGVDDLDDVMEFTTKHLSNYLKEPLLINPLLVEQIRHALELPLHWRMPRLHTRKEITKLGCLLTTIDDIYDVYGSLEELVLFTKAVDEWKIPEIQPLPTCMKIALRELFNIMNDIACAFSTEKGVDILPYLKRVWGDQCKSFLVEAIWYHTGHIPTISEYTENAWIMIGAPLFLTTAYCLSEELSIEALNSLEFYFDVTLYSGMISRLNDDLGTSTDELQRGDVPKSIQCYMNETNVSESAARDHIKHLIIKYWKLLNAEYFSNFRLQDSCKRYTLNFPRMSQCMYQYGDGHGKPNREIKDRIILLLIKPIPLN
ncbi:hypothetical protein M5K25_008721 [Dendrobium thyrsiflorum]|uniref:Uncharacterized protein n=1 Tax=Dendrobium thyrsiflorum TaxID=117978 RepID=A0ABD0V992_DENTH